MQPCPGLLLEPGCCWQLVCHFGGMKARIASVEAARQAAVYQCPCKLRSTLSASVHGKLCARIQVHNMMVYDDSVMVMVYKMKPAEMLSLKQLLSCTHNDQAQLPQGLLVSAHTTDIPVYKFHTDMHSCMKLHWAACRGKVGMLL